MIKKILNNKDQFSDLIVDTPNFVPDGVQIKKVEYKQNDYAIFDGQAISDIDLNIFLENLRNNLGTPDINNISIEIIEKENLNLHQLLLQEEVLIQLLVTLMLLPKHQKKIF